MYTLFLQRVGRESICFTSAIDKFALRDTFACHNSPLKTKVYLNRKVDGGCTRPMVFNLFYTATHYSITAWFGPIPKVLFLDTALFLQVGSRQCCIKDSNNKSHSFVKTALLTSDTSLNLSTT